MENKIQKIIICFEEGKSKTVKGFVVIKEKGVESVGFNEVNPMSHLKDLVSLLLKSYPEKAKEENIETELVKAGYIQTTRVNLVTNITVKKEDDEESFIVHYANNDIKEVKLSDCYDSSEYEKMLKEVKDEVCKFYEISYTSSNEQDEKLIEKGLLSKKEIKKEEEKEEEKKEEKKSNTTPIYVTPKGLIALGLATVLVGFGVGLSSNRLIAKYKASKNVLEEENPEDDVNKDNSLNTDNIVEVNQIEVSPVIFITPEERALMKNITPYFPNIDGNPEIVRVITNIEGLADQAYIVGQGEYSNINDAYNLSYQIVNGYTNYMYHQQSKPDETYLIHFENYFENEQDRIFVRYFSDLLNDAVYMYYKDNEDSLAVERIRDLVYEQLRVLQGGPIEITINGQKVVLRYSDISIEAKQFFNQLLDQTHQMLGDEVIYYNGEEWSRSRIDSDIFGRSIEESYGTR